MKTTVEIIEDQGLGEGREPLTFEALKSYVRTRIHNDAVNKHDADRITAVRHLAQWSYQQGALSDAELSQVIEMLEPPNTNNEPKSVNLEVESVSSGAQDQEDRNFSLSQNNRSGDNSTRRSPLARMLGDRRLRVLGVVVVISGLVGVGVFGLWRWQEKPLSNDGQVAGLYLDESMQEPSEGKILRFHGVLRDGNRAPIQTAVPVTFRLYPQSDSEVSDAVYVGSCEDDSLLSPSEDGSFEAIIGQDCGMDPIPVDVLEGVDTVYLGVSVGQNAEMSPRYEITTVAESRNTRQVQGLSLGSESSSIPYIDQEGRFHIDAVSPVISSSNGIFQIEGQVLVLRTNDEAEGPIILEGAGGLGFGTDRIVDPITLGSHTSPSEDNTFRLGSESNRFQSIYTTDLVLGSEGIGGFWQRKSNALSPTHEDETLILGSESESSAVVGFNADPDKPSWFMNGAFGLGIREPSHQLTALGTISSGHVVSLANTTVSDNSETGVLRLGLASDAEQSSFIDFYTNVEDDTDGEKVGSIGMVDGSLAFQTTGADYAEYLFMSEKAPTYAIVGISTSGARPSQLGDVIAGVVTDQPGVVGNNAYHDDPSYQLVGLLGQMKVLVTTENGEPLPGSMIGVSSIPGHGTVRAQRSSDGMVGVVLADPKISPDQMMKGLTNQACPATVRQRTDHEGNPIRCGVVPVLVRP